MNISGNDAFIYLPFQHPASGTNGHARTVHSHVTFDLLRCRSTEMSIMKRRWSCGTYRARVHPAPCNTGCDGLCCDNCDRFVRWAAQRSSPNVTLIHFDRPTDRPFAEQTAPHRVLSLLSLFHRTGVQMHSPLLAVRCPSG